LVDWVSGLGFQVQGSRFEVSGLRFGVEMGNDHLWGRRFKTGSKVKEVFFTDWKNFL
jgi:hypothetical protein